MQKVTSENLIRLRTAGWCWVVLSNIDKYAKLIKLNRRKERKKDIRMIKNVF